MAINRTSPKKGKVVDIPTVPTVGTATAGGESATVEYTASTKGGPATTFTALSNPGSITGTGSSSPITVSGLTAGTAYTFTVRGNNATGSSEYSAASNSVTPFSATSFESIATVNLTGGDSGSITFSSIPQTYKHLQFRVFARDNRAAVGNTIRWQFNGDTGNNYSSHAIYGDGATAATFTLTTDYGIATVVSSNSATSGVFGAFIMDVLDYTNTNKYKTTRTLAGYDNNGSGDIELDSGLWMNTSAINQIAVRFNSATALKQYSHLALYGIKG